MTSTDLAMNLAQLKLDLSKLTNKLKGTSPAFDAGIARAISGINCAIVNSIEATPDPNVPKGSHKRKLTTRQQDEARHSHWLEKQYQSIHFRSRRVPE